jgi:hypothetical protein
MTIKTSTFSGWQLSGKDAEAFLTQIEHAKPNKRAQETLRRGEKLLKEYDKKGYVILQPKRNES